MQLMPGTALQLGVKDSFSPEQNVHGGTQYLKELLERYNGDAVKALAAYNAGPAAVDRYKGVPPYRETRQYVQRIVRDYNKSKAGTLKEKPAEKRKTSELTQDHATVERAAK
jgi:soluble lytic murein transglycosylase-like protein